VKSKKKEPIVLPPVKLKKRNAAARVVNQKAQTMQEGPKRMGTRAAKDRKAIEEHS
jgi:hypothetical protein